MTEQGPQPDDEVVVLPPLTVDPVFAEMVDDAIAGEPTAASDVDPNRTMGADPHDFAGLYIRHRSSFSLHARRFLRDQRDVDEVVQEAFLRLFLALPELETELQALAYCRRTITNLCIDRYRADQRRPRLVDLDSLPVGELADEEPVDPVVQAEDAALVRRALAMLSPLHREALVKREIEEKTLPVIAAELDIPEDSVKHVLFRARRALRRILAGTHLEPGVDIDACSTLQLVGRRVANDGSKLAGFFMVLALALGLSGPDLRTIPVVGDDLPDLPSIMQVVRPDEQPAAAGRAPSKGSRPGASSQAGDRGALDVPIAPERALAPLQAPVLNVPVPLPERPGGPAASPSAAASPQATASAPPSAEPSPAPSATEGSAAPSAEPSRGPSKEPKESKEPKDPSPEPSKEPTGGPTAAPSATPSPTGTTAGTSFSRQLAAQPRVALGRRLPVQRPTAASPEGAIYSMFGEGPAIDEAWTPQTNWVLDEETGALVAAAPEAPPVS